MAGFDNDVIYGTNIDLSGSGSGQGGTATLLTNGQMLIASTALNAGGTHVNVGTLTSPSGTLTIGYSSPNITLDVASSGVVVERFAVQTGTSPVSPLLGVVTFNGATVSAGTNPVRTDGTNANTMALEVQISQAIAATDATKIGLSNFNSAQFTVDANGFVGLKGSSSNPGILGIHPNTTSGGGTDPTVSDASGNISILGNTVAAGTNPVRTVATAANSLTTQIQISQAIAATDVTKIGLSNFNSAQFAVDANGFVSTNGSGIPNTITGDSGGALSPSGGNWNLLGRSGSKTSGSGSTLTIKSPPFSQIGSSGTSSLNTGEIVTAAVTRTLPASAGLADGDLFIYVCTTAGALVIQAVSAQKIRIGNQISSAAGTATSTAIGDSLTLRFDATQGFFLAVSSMGNWTLA